MLVGATRAGYPEEEVPGASGRHLCTSSQRKHWRTPCCARLTGSIFARQAEPILVALPRQRHPGCDQRAELGAGVVPKAIPSSPADCGKKGRRCKAQRNDQHAVAGMHGLVQLARLPRCYFHGQMWQERAAAPPPDPRPNPWTRHDHAPKLKAGGATLDSTNSMEGHWDCARLGTTARAPQKNCLLGGFENSRTCRCPVRQQGMV